MRKINTICLITFLILTSCDFKSSADYNAEAEKLEKEGKFTESIHLLNKAIEKDPKNIYALINRGVDKSILEDYNGAIEDYSKVIEIDSNNTLAFLNRGKNKKRIKDYYGAIEDFNKAIATKGGETLYIEWNPNYFVNTGYEFDVDMEEIRFERGVAKYYIDSSKSAFNDFHFCIENGFELSSSYYWRGLIYLAYDMKKEGCIDLEKSQELGNPDAKEMIDKYCKK